ncbi:MAG: sel1 repeat family protein [Burkholderiaceae bacterium]|nr:sel1 repeat family protein [Burkholderiaceae bacterium]
MSAGYLGLEEGNRALQVGAYHQAFEIFMAMVESGEDPAFYKLCEMVLQGQLDDSARQTFIHRLSQDIEMGNGVAAFNAGVLYSRGLGFSLDLEKAVDMFNLAIANKVAEGYLALARLYIAHLGQLPLASAENIAELLEKGARAGSIEAAFTLGRLYTQGDVLRRDPSRGFLFLFLAAIQGHEDSKRALMVLQTMHATEPFEREQKTAKEMLYRIKNPYDEPEQDDHFVR